MVCGVAVVTEAVLVHGSVTVDGFVASTPNDIVGCGEVGEH